MTVLSEDTQHLLKQAIGEQGLPTGFISSVAAYYYPLARRIAASVDKLSPTLGYKGRKELVRRLVLRF